MTPSWIDHLLVVVLVAILPIEGAWMIRRLTASLARGERGARIRQYWITIGTEWALVAVALVVWIAAGRSLGALGFRISAGVGTLVGAIVTAVVLLFMAVQWRAILRLDGQGRTRIAGQFGSAIALLPRSAPEATVFRLLSVTAGICEEILYRGYLIWYFATWMNPWAAGLVAAVAFGLAHWYQGGANVLKTGLLGAIMGLFYLVTGSLLWPMILHAVVDIQGGAIGRLVLGDEPEPSPAT